MDSLSMQNCMHLRAIPTKYINSRCERAGKPTDGHQVKQ